MKTELVTEVSNEEMLAQSMLASLASEVTDDFGSASLRYISTIGGQLKNGDAPFTGNKIICVVLDYVRTNVLYMTKYSANNKDYRPPNCFSIGKKVNELIPHDCVEDKKGKNCTTCKYNQKGSASLIRDDASKDARACSNKMRLAILPIGYVEKTGEVVVNSTNLADEEILFLSVPLLSTFEFQNYAKKLATARNTPPCAVCTEITAETNSRGFIMRFNEVTQAINPDGELSKLNIATSGLMEIILKRKTEAEKLLLTPYHIPAANSGDVVDVANETTDF